MGTKAFNSLQLQAINAHNGRFLVLAPPGCGKTDILAERVAMAHSRGVALSDMLCLTFTNRAARGMLDRVQHRLGDDFQGIFVGNIHRLCSHLLFDNELISANTSIIDEDDQNDIFLAFETDRFFHNYRGDIQRDTVNQVVNIACHIYQRRHGHDPANCLGGTEGESCFNLAKSYHFEHNLIPENSNTASLTRYALQYALYKEQNHLFDFNDILARAYELLIHPDADTRIKRYPWIQVDEVQDLNPLQMAIIEEITLPSPETTVMYLGDEQQAIFSFIGAKLEHIEALRQRCGNNVINLGVNYRSAKYLLNVFNTYAEHELHINPALLPTANNDNDAHSANDLIIAQNDTYKSELARIEGMISYYTRFEGERLALLVPNNKTADDIAKLLESRHIDHFKISGSDIFRSKDYRMLASVFALLGNEYNESAWVRLLHGLGVAKRLFDARAIVKHLREHMMTVSDLLISQTLLEHFVDVYENQEIVVFDTETTGLDTRFDDIVQIAAFKMLRGEKVAGSDFNVFLETDSEIPPKLGVNDNPLIEEYPLHPHLNRAEALRSFLDYIGNDPVLGHNVAFDVEVLRENCRRELSEEIHLTDILDSLAIIKRVNPTLRRYKLEFLLDALNLEGANSHLADEDIEATRSLVNYCYAQAKPVVPEQRKIHESSRALSIRNQLEIVKAVMDNLTDVLNRPIAVTGLTLATAFGNLYSRLVDEKLCSCLGEKFDYFLRYIDAEWMPANELDTLAGQITLHINDFTSTISEADLVNSDNLINNHQVFVMTVYKAKGLEFDNVVILNAVDGCYPFFGVRKLLNSNDEKMRREGERQYQEEQRKFYVGLTRARKRICISYHMTNDGGHSTTLTPFMSCISGYFRPIGPQKKTT